MYEFLRENIKWPEISKDASIEGTVYIGFVINIDGNFSDVKVERGIHPAFNEEAVRVVNLMSGKWIAGQQGGKPARTTFTLPIKFRLE